MPINRAGGAAPVSTIAHFAANAIPAGWLKANGEAVARAAYPALFAAIGVVYGAGDGATTFNLPDLRGEFMRGLDDGRGVDVGRAMGSAQLDAVQGHEHALRTQQGTVSGQTDAVSRNTDNSNTNTTNSAILQMISDGVNGTPRIAAETRPRNVALLACIKF